MSDLTKSSCRELRKRITRDLRAHEVAVADLKTALADLDATERLLGRLEKKDSLSGARLQLTKFEALPFSVGNPFRQGSIKSIIWEVLKRSPETWLTTEAVRQEASRLMGRDLASASVGVALSRMKRHIRREGLKVAQTIRALDEMF